MLDNYDLKIMQAKRVRKEKVKNRPLTEKESLYLETLCATGSKTLAKREAGYVESGDGPKAEVVRKKHEEIRARVMDRMMDAADKALDVKLELLGNQKVSARVRNEVAEQLLTALDLTSNRHQNGVTINVSTQDGQSLTERVRKVWEEKNTIDISSSSS